MRIVRFHPHGMPPTERYSVTHIRVKRYSSSDVDTCIGYLPNWARGLLFEQVQVLINHLSPDGVLVVNVVRSSKLSPFAGATIFGSLKVERFVKAHAPSYISTLGELETLWASRAPERAVPDWSQM